MKPRPLLKIQVEPSLKMTLELCQALEILQMPQLELGQWLFKEIDKNPLLELSHRQGKKRFEGEIAASETLYELLLRQIRENLEGAERKIGEHFLEHLDERGFITCSIQTESEEKVLRILQTFDPPGIFARNLQEALLIQLRAKGKNKSPAFHLVENCFEDLLHGRYTLIKKKMQIEDLKHILSELACLSLRPAHSLFVEPTIPVYPDLEIRKIEGGWAFQLIEEEIPSFHIRADYLNAETDSKEEKESLQTFKSQAKWIIHSLNRRRDLLRRMGRIIIQKQAAFLDQKGPLTPIKSKDLAEELGIHESTLSRALNGKYASTPRGILPLRSLVCQNPDKKNLASELQKLVEEEDKHSPLTDEQLATALQAQGYKVARRTIAKYRTQHKIGSAIQRKHLRSC
jgi:RNA polymerase sigma-54 factor